MIIIASAILLFFIFAVCKHRENKVKDKYFCDEGSFIVYGNKKCFHIKKGDRFIFTVKDGQIVSFIDKNTSNSIINYGSTLDENN